MLASVLRRGQRWPIVGTALDPQLVARVCQVVRHSLDVVAIHAFGPSATGDPPGGHYADSTLRIEKRSGALTAPRGDAVTSAGKPPRADVCARGLPPEQPVFHDPLRSFRPECAGNTEVVIGNLTDS